MTSIEDISVPNSIEGTYSDLRQSIEDGDLLYIRDGNSIWSRVTQFITKSPHYHVGIAVWMTDGCSRRRLMLLEAHTGGRRIVTLSTYIDHRMDVIRPVFDFSLHSDQFIEHAGRVPYSLPDYVSIGAAELLRIRLGDFRGEVCSGLVADYLGRSAEFSGMPKQISPGEQFRWLTAHGYSDHVFSIHPE